MGKLIYSMQICILFTLIMLRGLICFSQATKPYFNQSETGKYKSLLTLFQVQDINHQQNLGIFMVTFTNKLWFKMHFAVVKQMEFRKEPLDIVYVHLQNLQHISKHITVQQKKTMIMNGMCQ